ncbi:MAG: FISUMP domain-containing protein [Bacteroidales bacterium]|nr:FISUMP domain-containing protein [Bacteroidales bacterium]
MALMLCCAMTVFAQNDKISYQAVVRGTDNHLVVNTAMTVTVSLANSEDGAAVYTETHAVTSNMNGLISLLIGDGTPVSGNWADVQWSNAWVTADIACGSTHIATHKMPLSAVPYALQAGYADSVNTNVIANYLATHPVPGVSNVQSDWSVTDVTSDVYIKNKPTNLVTTDGTNTYTGANDFTGGTTKVASGFKIGTTTAANCNNMAVNACDLLAAFDSLSRSIQGVYDSLGKRIDSLKHLNDSLAKELAALKSPTLTLTSDPDGGSVSLCGNTSVEVVYTATLSNANAEDYTFAWTVDGVVQSGNGSTLTHTYTAASDVKVVCVATRAGYATLKDSLTTTVNDGAAVSLSLSVNNFTVTVVSMSGDPTSISWGDGSTATSVSDNMTHTYSTSGTYTITATNSDGCKATDTMELAEVPHTTCTLSEMGNTTLNVNERGSAPAIDSVKDHEGNWYEVVQIGNQCWLKENLRTRTSPKTGTYLVNTAGKTGNSAAHYFGSKVAHWYMNDSTTYAPKGYGLLYNWCAAMDTANPANYMEVPTPTAGNNEPFNFTPSGNHRGICPIGWHVPSDAEWNTMEAEVNGSDVSSTQLRGSHAGKLSTGSDWDSTGVAQNTTDSKPGNYSYAERNSSGFSAVPAGIFFGSDLVNPDEIFVIAGVATTFWSSSHHLLYSDVSYEAWYRTLSFHDVGVFRSHEDKDFGLSVRCVRD